jgi:hypothetical protein
MAITFIIQQDMRGTTDFEKLSPLLKSKTPKAIIQKGFRGF